MISLIDFFARNHGKRGGTGPPGLGQKCNTASVRLLAAGCWLLVVLGQSSCSLQS